MNKKSRKAKSTQIIRKCALYGRVSTQRQAMVEDGGLDTQFSCMDAAIKFENEKDNDEVWEVVDRYREEGRSGKDLDRPEFQRMMADIHAGKVDTVIVYKIDRITRSLRDFFTLWETFETNNVQFVSLHEKFDTTTAVGRAMLKLILVFAELEREQTAERTAAVMQHRAEQGLWNGGSIPLGYDLDPDEKGVLKINEEQKEILINDFFKKCVELGSGSSVLQHLKEQGIVRPRSVTKKGKPKGGGRYYKQAVINILTDQVYLGKVEHKGEIYDGKHDAIVPEDLFMQVQDIIKRNGDTCTNTKAQTEHVYLLKGLVRCGKCGSLMTPKSCSGRNKTRNFYYVCNLRERSARTECDAAYLPADTVENFVVDQISAWAQNRSEIELAVEAASKYQGEEVAAITSEINAVRAQLREKQSALSNLMSAIEAGADFKTLGERIITLEKDKAAVEERINRLELERADREKKSLSAEVAAASYCDSPFIVNRRREKRDLHGLRELLSCYIAAIDVHQQEDDPSSGHMEIMLFEEEIPGWEATAHQKTLAEQPLDGRNSERMNQLPR